jgi:hypothetical protein
MLPTPKPVTALTRIDFAGSPVWEWMLDNESFGSDESYVQPVPGDMVPRGQFRQYLVAAVATLKDKTEIPACVMVTIEGQGASFRPEFVFLLDRQLPFVSNETERLMSRYTTRSGNRVVRWRLGVPLQGESQLRQGSVRRSFGYVLVSLAIRIALRRLSGGRA